MERFYQHLEGTLSDTGFLVKNHPGEAMKRLQQRTAYVTRHIRISG